MSHDKLISKAIRRGWPETLSEVEGPPPRPSQFPKTLTLARRLSALPDGGKEVPKWNRSAVCLLPICAALERKPPSHSLALKRERFTLRHEGPLTIRHRLEKLENCLTRFHSATSIFLIDNFYQDLSGGISSCSTLIPVWIESGEEAASFLIAKI